MDNLVCTVDVMKMPSLQPAVHLLRAALSSFHCSLIPPHIHIIVTLMLLFLKSHQDSSLSAACPLVHYRWLIEPEKSSAQLLSLRLKGKRPFFFKRPFVCVDDVKQSTFLQIVYNQIWSFFSFFSFLFLMLYVNNYFRREDSD